MEFDNMFEIRTKLKIDRDITINGFNLVPYNQDLKTI